MTPSCLNCGKARGDHKAESLLCLSGKRTRIGWIHYGPTRFVERGIMKWVKSPPAASSESFWCWVKYRGKNRVVKCPARVTRLDGQVLVSTAMNDSFVGEGETWRYGHVIDATLRFGPMIEEP